jgi:uncharacterized membrane protein
MIVMASKRILLAGESWVSATSHFKGFDFMITTNYDTGLPYLRKALETADVALTHIPNHLADREFPDSLEALSGYDVVILSDIGSNTLLLHPDTWLHSKVTPNRLKLLKEWVVRGGGLAMCGGYYSFAGLYGAAKYYRTPVEDVLPVNILTFDDRIEIPEGAVPEVVEPMHPILEDMPRDWPVLLGLNELVVKSDARLLVKANGHPLLAVRNVERGRTLAWASDIGPHWCPAEFATWDGYTRLWIQAIEWLAGGR